MAPRGMKGCVGRDPKGRNLRFDYNLSSCANAPDGDTCPKVQKAGVHASKLVVIKLISFAKHTLKTFQRNQMQSDYRKGHQFHRARCQLFWNSSADPLVLLRLVNVVVGTVVSLSTKSSSSILWLDLTNPQHQSLVAFLVRESSSHWRVHGSPLWHLQFGQTNSNTRRC